MQYVCIVYCVSDWLQINFDFFVFSGIRKRKGTLPWIYWYDVE